jgi:hypothetical protein
MCSTSEVTAASWLVSAPVCPWVPMGMRAARAPIATSIVGIQERTANVSTVSTAPAMVVTSQACPTELSTRKRPSCCPKTASRVGLALRTLRNVR